MACWEAARTRPPSFGVHSNGPELNLLKKMAEGRACGYTNPEGGASKQ
jgi:hypothetical protein